MYLYDGSRNTQNCRKGVTLNYEAVTSLFRMRLFAHMSPKYVYQIFSDSDIVFIWHPFWYFSLICYPAHLDSHRDFMLHILMYLFFTVIHKRNNATKTKLCVLSLLCTKMPNDPYGLIFVSLISMEHYLH